MEKPPPNPDEAIIQEALRLECQAEGQGILLRILGAAAVRLHCCDQEGLFKTLDRPVTDLDFISYQTSARFVPGFMSSQGYIPNQEVLALFGGERQIYDHPDTGMHVDVFFDRLSFCHRIDLRGRLELDTPTIPLADLILGKLQIVKLCEKDLKDLTFLFAEHDVGQDDRESIAVNRIVQVLGRDWGFYHTGMATIEALTGFVIHAAGLGSELREKILGRLWRIKQSVNSAPKSFGWKLRASIGTWLKWYTDVDEVP